MAYRLKKCETCGQTKQEIYCDTCGKEVVPGGEPNPFSYVLVSVTGRTTGGPYHYCSEMCARAQLPAKAVNRVLGSIKDEA